MSSIRPQLERSIRRTVVAAVCALAFAAPAAADCTDDHKSVLLVYSQRSDFGFTAAASERFVQTLRDGLNGCLDDYSESLDAARFDETDDLAIFRDFLARKYANVAFDLIVTFQRPALSFVAQFGPALFPGTPVFFVAGKGLEEENRSPGPNFAGALYKVDLRRSIDVALRLQPGLERIYVVSGGSEFDRGYERGAREQFVPYGDRVQFTYLSGLPIGEMLSAVGRLEPNSAVYLMSVTADRFGNRFTRADVTARIAAASSVPVYTAYAVFMNLGVLGGSLVNVDRVLDDAAPAALRLLRGEPLASVGVTELDPNELVFDSRQFARWRIDESRLPAGSTILFRQPNIWQQRSGLVVATLAVLTTQMALIAALLLQRTRRHRAETRARELAGRLITAEETERKRIARELHDGICQEVACLAVDLTFLKGKDAAIAGELQAIRQRTDGIAESLRLVSHDLHPIVLQHVGFLAALQSHCAEVERLHKFRVTVATSGDVEPANAGTRLSLFRIVQEALRNAARHGRPRNAAVALARGDRELTLTLSDDGAGFQTSAAGRRGLGLLSIEERVRLMNGRVSVQSRPGAGTRVEIHVPLSVVDYEFLEPDAGIRGTLPDALDPDSAV